MLCGAGSSAIVSEVTRISLAGHSCRREGIKECLAAERSSLTLTFALFLASLSSSPRSHRLERTLVSDKRIRVHCAGTEGLTGLATI